MAKVVDPGASRTDAKAPAAPAVVDGRSRLLVLVVVAVLGSAWLLHGQPLDERRVPAAYPAIDRVSVATGVPSGDLFRQIDAAIADQLPARAPIVRSTFASMVAAGVSPNSIVFRGPSGEPFYSPDFTHSCATQSDIAHLDDKVRALRTKLQATGATLLFAVAPDKTQIDRAQIGPLADALLQCSDANVASMKRMAAAPDAPEFVDFDALARANETTRQYIWGDTHWNWSGASTFAHDLLLRLESDGVVPRGDAASAVVAASPRVNRPDDLYDLMGAPRSETLATSLSAPPGVASTSESEAIDGWTVTRWQSTSTQSDLVPGRTLLIADSFAYIDTPYLAHDFSDLTLVPFAVLDHPGHLVSTAGYDHVIVQELQRNLPLYLDQIDGTDWVAGPRVP